MQSLFVLYDGALWINVGVILGHVCVLFVFRATSGGGSSSQTSASSDPGPSQGNNDGTANPNPAGNLGTSQGSGPSPNPSQPANILGKYFKKPGRGSFYWYLIIYFIFLFASNGLNANLHSLLNLQQLFLRFTIILIKITWPSVLDFIFAVPITGYFSCEKNVFSYEWRLQMSLLYQWVVRFYMLHLQCYIPV